MSLIGVAYSGYFFKPLRRILCCWQVKRGRDDDDGEL